jgi:hypothetical protein
MPSRPTPPTSSSVSVGTSKSVNVTNATKTLAERLQDLAVANDEGLIDDEEYRVLRQNLFEKYAGGTGDSKVDAGPILSPRDRGMFWTRVLVPSVLVTEHTRGGGGLLLNLCSTPIGWALIIAD